MHSLYQSICKERISSLPWVGPPHRDSNLPNKMAEKRQRQKGKTSRGILPDTALACFILTIYDILRGNNVPDTTFYHP